MGKINKILIAISATIAFPSLAFSQDIKEMEELLIKQPTLVNHEEQYAPNPRPLNFFIEGNVGVYPSTSFGIMTGLCGKTVGFYVMGRTGFNNTSETCTSDGHYADGTDMWTSGNVRYLDIIVTGGLVVRMAKSHIFPYLGAGYGLSSIQWQDYGGGWFQVADRKINGVALNGGVMFQFYHITLSLGVSNTAFKHTVAEVGVGLMF